MMHFKFMMMCALLAIGLMSSCLTDAYVHGMSRQVVPSRTNNAPVPFDTARQLAFAPGDDAVLGWWSTSNIVMGMEDLLNMDAYLSPKNYPIVVLGESFIAVDQQKGAAYWGGGIPKLLEDKLKGRDPSSPSVDVICLGPTKDSYFVQFSDGEAQSVGIPTALDKAIRENAGSRVKAIAIGPDDNYHCLWENGRADWSLKTADHNLLISRNTNALPAAETLNLGPNGECFVRFEDGDWRARGTSVSCDDAVNQIQTRGDRVYDIQFGHNWSWLVRYVDSNSKIWDKDATTQPR